MLRVNKAHKSFLITAYYDGQTIEWAREIIERGGYDHLSQETIDAAVAEIKGCTGYDWVGKAAGANDAKTDGVKRDSASF